MASTDTDDSPEKVRSFRPRRRLPSGRAVAGALLVTAAAVGAFALANRDDSGPQTLYLVAARPVRAGDTISVDDVAFEPMTLPAKVAANAVTSPEGVDQATVTRDLLPGDVISPRDLLAAPQAAGTAVGAIHEVALPIDGARLPGGVANGDRVTVLSTLRSGDEPVTVVAIEDAVVLSWLSGNAAQGVLTLAVDDAAAAMALIHLSRQGETSVTRTTRSTGDSYPALLSTSRLLESAAGRPADQSASNAAAP